MSMFCYQCQETAMGTGCTLKGVCGKTSEVANLQDLLLFVVRGIAVYNEHLRREGHPSEEADKFIYDALFITITNANFDKAAIIRKIKEGLQLKIGQTVFMQSPRQEKTGTQGQQYRYRQRKPGGENPERQGHHSPREPSAKAPVTHHVPKAFGRHRTNPPERQTGEKHQSSQ